MSQNKRMVYIWDENVEFYNALPNKADFINRLIADARLGRLPQKDFRTETDQNYDALVETKSAWEVDQNPQPKLEGIDDPSHPDWHPDSRIRETRKQLNAMDARDKQNVADSRGGN